MQSQIDLHRSMGPYQRNGNGRSVVREGLEHVSYVHVARMAGVCSRMLGTVSRKWLRQKSCFGIVSQVLLTPLGRDGETKVPTYQNTEFATIVFVSRMAFKPPRMSIIRRRPCMCILSIFKLLLSCFWVVSSAVFPVSFDLCLISHHTTSGHPPRVVGSTTYLKSCKCNNSTDRLITHTQLDSAIASCLLHPLPQQPNALTL